MPHIYYSTGKALPVARLASAVLLFVSASFAQATNLRLAWNASADPAVTGYKLSSGTSSGHYSNSLNAGSGTSATVNNLVPGNTYYFAVTAYNSIGLQSVPSNEVSLHVSNLPPSVSLTSPTAGASLDGNTPIGITADASDPDGSISKVEFYQGSNKIGESTSAPYATTWSNAPSGTFNLSALAFDDGGAAVRSSGVSITVTGTAPAATPSPTTNKVRVASMTPLVRAGGMAIFKVVASEMNVNDDTLVNYALGGTATPGIQYTMAGVTSQVMIPRGRRSALVDVQTLSVPAGTSTTTAVMTVLPGNGYIPARGTAVVKIIGR